MPRNLTLLDTYHVSQSNLSLRQTALFYAGVIVGALGVILSILAGILSGEFTLRTWPPSVSELVAVFSSDYGRIFFSLELVASILLLLSWRFAQARYYEVTERWKIIRHVVICVGYMIVSTVPVTHAETGPRVLLLLLHLSGAFGIIVVYPVTQLYLYWHAEEEETHGVWLNYVSLSAFFVFVIIEAVVWLWHSTPALAIISFSAELVAIFTVLLDGVFYDD